MIVYRQAKPCHQGQPLLDIICVLFLSTRPIIAEELLEIMKFSDGIFLFLCIMLINIPSISSPVSLIKPDRVMGPLLISASLFYA